MSPAVMPAVKRAPSPRMKPLLRGASPSAAPSSPSSCPASSGSRPFAGRCGRPYAGRRDRPVAGRRVDEDRRARSSRACSATSDDGTARGACDFNDFWNDGWTPKHLLRGEANVYKQIAIALKGGAWRKASMVMVAQAVAEGGVLQIGASLVR